MITLVAPSTPLRGGPVVLRPLGQSDANDLERLARGRDVRCFTYAPSQPEPGFGLRWARRYEDGWADGTRAGFGIRDAQTSEFLGFVALIDLDLAARQGEAGYAVKPEACGRGIATQALALLTSWGFAELRLKRIELRIDPVNTASERVAERCGYLREGVLRCVHFKEGRRTDVAIWSRISSDRP